MSKYKSTLYNFDKYFNKEYGVKANIQNLFSLLEPKFSYFEHYHHPQPYLKRTWEKVYSIYGQEIQKTSSSKFREAENICHNIFRYWHLTNGDFVPRYAGDFQSFNLNSLKEVEKCIKSMKQKRFVCINDVPELGNDQYEDAKHAIITALESIFRNKSSFEM